MSNASLEAPGIQVVARHGLVEESSPITLTPDEAALAIRLARSDRISGLLASAIDSGALVVDDAIADVATTVWREQLRASVVLEGLVVRTSTVFTEATIRHRLTKGAAVAHLDFGDPSLRPFGDVDLVVHPADWQAALDLLAGIGHHRPATPLPAGYDERYGKGATWYTDDGLSVDLHRRFAIGRFGVTSHTPDVFESRDAIVLAGVGIPTLTAPDRLVHACYHAVLGGRPRIRAFRDIAQLVLHTQVDWQAAFDRASSWRAEAVLARGIVGSWRRLGLTVEHPALDHARSVQISRRDAWALRQFQEPTSFRRQASTTALGVPTREIPVVMYTMAAGYRQRRRAASDRRC